jgi:thioredoxin-like negative regulator of GroEL
MASRRLLTLTAIISSLIGAVVVYMVISIPNDLKSDTLLKEARHQLEKGNRDKARQSLSRIVQQYPRTDAAAAATIALLTISDQDVRELRSQFTKVKAEHDEERKQINALTRQVSDVPNLVAAAIPPPASPAAKAATPSPKKKTTAHHKKKTTRRRRRR